MHRVLEITKGKGWITQVVAGHQAKGVCMCVGGGLGDKHQRAPQKQHLLHDWSVQKKRAAGDKEQKRESKPNYTNTHRKPRAQVLRAFIADVIISEVHARQSPVDLPRKTKKTVSKVVTGGG